MGRLLLLSCSEAKVPDPEPLPAIQRYDGPAFRVVRKFLREAPPDAQDVEIYILSAKYGLIPDQAEIEPYDRRMTQERAAELREATLEEFDSVIERHKPSELFLSLGRDYLRAVEGFRERVLADTRVIVSDGSAGKKLTALKAWLYGQRAIATRSREGIVRQPGLPLGTRRSVQIRGQLVSLSTEEAIERARRALAEGWGEPERFRTWYTFVDDRRVSPKWWVSLLSDLPVRSFAADEARRVLRALGIEVYRTDN